MIGFGGDGTMISIAAGSAHSSAVYNCVGVVKRHLRIKIAIGF